MSTESKGYEFPVRELVAHVRRGLDAAGHTDVAISDR